MSPADRERVLDAAAGVMSRLGLSGVTIDEIARAAGCSQAVLQEHFLDGADITRAVLRDRLPDLPGLVAELPGRAGTGTVAAHLTEVVNSAVPFFAAGMLVAASLYPRESLEDRHRAWLTERAAEAEAGDAEAGDQAGDGPGNAAPDPERRESRRPKTGNEGIEEYLRAEQRLGRVAAHVDPDAAAARVINACYQQAHLTRLSGANVLVPPAAAFADAVVATALWR